MKEQIRMFFAWHWAPWCVTAVVMVCILLFGGVFRGAEIDMMSRYAPMAEAFAEGNWKEFYHPRFGLFFQTLTGCIVWITGCSGDWACIWLSLVAWALAIPTLFAIMERLFDRTVAWVTIALYLVCPMLLVWALFGMRESCRTLATLWAFYALMRRISKEPSMALMMGAMLIFCTLRSDTLLIAMIFGVAYAVIDHFRMRTWGLLLWCFLCVQPVAYATWCWTGVWLPSAQYVFAWERLF